MIPINPFINNQIPYGNQPQINNNPNNFQQQFNQFVQNFRQSNITPQQAVQNMLNSGQMTQEQFNQYRQMANMLTGKNL